MTRKRAAKLLMARGCSRNCANSLMRAKPPGYSNESHYIRITLARRLRDSALAFARLSAVSAFARLSAVSAAARCAMFRLAQAVNEIKGGTGL